MKFDEPIETIQYEFFIVIFFRPHNVKASLGSINKNTAVEKENEDKHFYVTRYIFMTDILKYFELLRNIINMYGIRVLYKVVYSTRVNIFIVCNL